MIKIRSTQKLATSDKYGLCDIVRQMLSYSEDLVTGKVTIIIKDQLVLEEAKQRVEMQLVDEVETEVTVDFVERMIVEDRIAKAFVFPNATIDSLFSLIGSDILKAENYTTQQNATKTTILIAQTISASANGWQGMNSWEEDTEHEIVTKFTL